VQRSSTAGDGQPGARGVRPPYNADTAAGGVDRRRYRRDPLRKRDRLAGLGTAPGAATDVSAR